MIVQGATFVYSGERRIATRVWRPDVPPRRRRLKAGWVDGHSDFDRPCTSCGTQGDIDTVLRHPPRDTVRLCSRCSSVQIKSYLSTLTGGDEEA